MYRNGKQIHDCLRDAVGRAVKEGFPRGKREFFLV